MRRALEDMAARVLRLEHTSDPDVRANLLDDIDEWGFRRLDHVVEMVTALMSLRATRQ